MPLVPLQLALDALDFDRLIPAYPAMKWVWFVVRVYSAEVEQESRMHKQRALVAFWRAPVLRTIQRPNQPAANWACAFGELNGHTLVSDSSSLF